MPSGAKRRKAAKKKKELVGIHNQGNGDSSKFHDEKDSDSGDLNSPTTSNEHRNPLRKDGDENLDGSKSFEEKSQFGGDDGEVIVTKEVDSESRVIDIEPVKVGGSSGSSSSDESDVDEKEEGGSGVELEKGVPIDEPSEGVVLVTKEVIHDGPVKEVVNESEEVIPNVKVNLAGEIGSSSTIDKELKDKEECVLPPSSGPSVETSNDGGFPLESPSRANTDTQKKDVAPLPPTIRPTSWKSCCGLFDVLTGSNR